MMSELKAFTDKYVEKFTELDDLQMKKLQTMYYIIIAISGVIIFSFA